MHECGYITVDAVHFFRWAAVNSSVDAALLISVDAVHFFRWAAVGSSVDAVHHCCSAWLSSCDHQSENISVDAVHFFSWGSSGQQCIRII
jgi:hypothetical protein